MRDSSASIRRRSILPLGLLGVVPGRGHGPALAQPSAGLADPAPRGPSTGPAAQPGWPERPVRMVTPGGPGTGLDLGARLLCDGLARRLGQPFLVENRPGADAIVAAEAHARARPGESLLFSFTGVASVTPFVHERVPYQPVDEIGLT